MAKLLEGVKVLDLSRVLAGPYCGMMLADMGADVIKVEMPGRGDDARKNPPIVNGYSAYYMNLNRNKRGMDKQSGADFERVQYRRMLRRLGPGDTLIVKSVDRLGRNYTEILEQWRIITKSKRAAIVILDMPLLDTRQNRDLTGQLIADIVLQLLSYVAQTEREFIRQRQAEGIVAAKERGVHFGREAAPISEGFPEILAEWRAKKLGSRAAAEQLGVSQTTFLKWAKAEKAGEK